MRSKPTKLKKTRKSVTDNELLEPDLSSDGELNQESHESQGSQGSDEEQELLGEGDVHLPVLSGSSTPSLSVDEDSALPSLPPHLDPLKRYLQEVARYALLSPEEELDLALRLRDKGDIEAAKRLVQANLRLVVKIAMEYRSAYQNVLDLIQEGNVGLMKAVSKFDPSKGARLSYYASWWIRSYILKYILDNFRLVRVGTTAAQKKLFFHLIREKERLQAQGIDAGPKLLADKFNVREKDVIEMEKRLGGNSGDVSLNQTLGGEGDSKATHQDMLADPHQSAEETIEWDELKKILGEHLAEFTKTLKEKELAVFRERLAAEIPKTLQEVADLFGLTRERARQIETNVIEKLREFYKQYMR